MFVNIDIKALGKIPENLFANNYAGVSFHTNTPVPGCRARSDCNGRAPRGDRFAGAGRERMSLSGRGTVPARGGYGAAVVLERRREGAVALPYAPSMIVQTRRLS